MIEDAVPKIYCVNHSNRETLLRCNRCERPICTECAVLTETGYRCKDCVRGQQKVFETARWADYPLAIGVAGILAFVGSIVAGLLGFFTLFIAPVAGVLIAEAVRWVVRKRRSRWLYRSAALAAAAGGSILLLIDLLSLVLGMGGFALWAIIWRAVFVILITSTVYYRLSGINIR